MEEIFIKLLTLRVSLKIEHEKEKLLKICVYKGNNSITSWLSTEDKYSFLDAAVASHIESNLNKLAIGV